MQGASSGQGQCLLQVVVETLEGSLRNGLPVCPQHMNDLAHVCTTPREDELNNTIVYGSQLLTPECHSVSRIFKLPITSIVVAYAHAQNMHHHLITNGLGCTLDATNAGKATSCALRVPSPPL